MERLSATLCQQIVDQAMPIVGHNVNVMDAHGVIIGSGDPRRLRKVHEGAVVAVGQARKVTIDNAAVRTLRGVQPGVNLPIRFRGEIVGVVGITGNPIDVDTPTELLRVLAEMMIDQAHSLEHHHAIRRERSDFLVEVARGELHDVAALQAWATALRIDPNSEHEALVLMPRRCDARGLDLLSQIGREFERDHDTLVGRSTADEVIVLRSVPPRSPAATEAEVARWIGSRTSTDAVAQVRLGVGFRCRGVSGFGEAIESARVTLRAGTRLCPDRNIHLIDDVAAAALVTDLHEPWRRELLSTPWERLRQADKSGELARTFRAYAEHFNDLQACAAALHVHRNTLRQRIERIATVTGLDLRSLPDLVRLYLSSVTADDKRAGVERASALSRA